MTDPFEILLSPPDVGELEQRFVLRALQSGWVAPAGPDLDAFEQEVAERVGVTHAVGLSSGTAALHLALVSWGVGPGDVVPVSTFTFTATVNAIRYVGAQPHFVDCDPVSGNMSPTLLDKAVSGLRLAGARIPAIIPVDVFGKCVEYDAIEEIAKAAGARLLCDAAESFGATYNGKQAGSFGNASALSFNGNKVMTTSGGGMLLTEDRDLARHARKLSGQAREPVAHYQHTEVGYNYRLSNILAALGRAQLSRLDEMLDRRRRLRERYRKLFSDVDGADILGGESDASDNCWLTAIFVDEEQSGWSATDLANSFTKARIETRPVWKPMHQQPVWRGVGGTLNGSSDALFRSSLTLPSGAGLSDDDFRAIERVIEGTVNP